jgi:hypothetical protein
MRHSNNRYAFGGSRNQERRFLRSRRRGLPRFIDAHQLVRQDGESSCPFCGAHPLQPAQTHAPTVERLRKKVGHGEAFWPVAAKPLWAHIPDHDRRISEASGDLFAIGSEGEYLNEGTR